MSNDNLVKIGTFISELRKESRLTQKELADQLGVTDKAVSKWERGLSYPDISLISNLAQILGVTSNELLDGEKTAPSASGTPPEDETRLRRANNAWEKSAKPKHPHWKNTITLFAIVVLSILLFIGANAAIEGRLGWAFPPLGLALFISAAAIIGTFIMKKNRVGSILLCGSLIYFITYFYTALNSTPYRETAGSFPRVYLPHYTIVILILLTSIAILTVYFLTRKKVRSGDFLFLLGGLSISILIISFLTVSAIIDFVDLNGLGVNPIFTILLLLTDMVCLVFLAVLARRQFDKSTVAQ